MRSFHALRRLFVVALIVSALMFLPAGATFAEENPSETAASQQQEEVSSSLLDEVVEWLIQVFAPADLDRGPGQDPMG